MVMFRICRMVRQFIQQRRIALHCHAWATAAAASRWEAGSHIQLVLQMRYRVLHVPNALLTRGDV